MRTIKKTLAFLLVLAMLAAVPVCTVSAEDSAPIIDAEVLNSITYEEGDTGYGLAFRVKMNIKGAKIDAWNNFINTDATAVYNGVEYSVVKMGAVMANKAADIVNKDNLTLEDVTGKYILDIPAKFLCAEPEANFCEFAVRVIKLPDAARGAAIACRPYVVLENGDEDITVYADSADISTYNTHYYTNAPEETPALDVSGLKAVITKTRLSVTAASAAYENYETTNYYEAFKVSLTLSNISANAKTSVGDIIAYTFKDAEGNVLGTTTVAVDEVLAGETKDVEFYAPISTATIERTDINLNYVPDITLPAIGTDIDVTKKKNRIRVSAAEASFNEDGTIHVALTFKNYTSNWITEETDYVKYGYYKDGTRKGTATLYIGVIDTKKNPVKTFEFDVPAYTTEVRLTASKIVYWTEWA